MRWRDLLATSAVTEWSGDRVVVDEFIAAPNRAPPGRASGVWARSARRWREHVDRNAPPLQKLLACDQAGGA